MSIQTITPNKIQELRQAGTEIDLIDVRAPAEFLGVHADIARCIPYELLDPRQVMEARNGRHDEPLYVICRLGILAEKACHKFVAAGYENVVNVAGGTKAWEKSGLPVVRGKQTISLERQVRIAAGLMVFIGAAMGFFVHPYWLAVPAFVGAGLAFAGVTDTCGMGMMLAKMPWNQVKIEEPQQCSLRKP